MLVLIACCGGLTLASHKVSTRLLYHSPSSGPGKGNMTKCSWVNIKTGQGEITHPLLSWAKQSRPGEIDLINCQSKVRAGRWEVKTNLKAFSSHSSFLLMLNFTHNFLYLLPIKQHTGTENGVHGQFIACCLCCFFLLILFPCPSTESIPWGIVLCKLLQDESLLLTAVLHELHAHIITWFLPETCSTMGNMPHKTSIPSVLKNAKWWDGGQQQNNC